MYEGMLAALFERLLCGVANLGSRVPAVCTCPPFGTANAAVCHSRGGVRCGSSCDLLFDAAYGRFEVEPPG